MRLSVSSCAFLSPWFLRHILYFCEEASRGLAIRPRLKRPITYCCVGDHTDAKMQEIIQPSWRPTQ